MKNPFKRNRKPEPKPEPTTPTRVKTLVDLPAALVERGVLIRIDEDGPRPVEPEGEVLERLGVPVSVQFDPNAFGHEGRAAWVVKAKLDFSYKGCIYGVDGPKLVRSIGLVFPNDATPWASHISVTDDGLEWGQRVRPDAQEIAQVIQEAQRQVAQIMRRYGETKEILAALKESAK